MITTHQLDTRSEAPEAPSRPVKLHWYVELALVAGFYFVYSVVRNQFGSASVNPSQAFSNALHVIRAERAVDLFVEIRIQETFLGWRPFMQAWNVFYGTFHFVVTAGVMIFLFRRFPARYRHWRTILGFTTAVALLGFSLYPLMPPRLLGDFGPFGGHSLQYRFIDSLSDFGGPWSFSSGGMKSLSNQYAAMPSLHVAWATWCALAIRPVVRRRWVRLLFFAYPLVTLFAVVVTANHYWLDGLGGLVALAIGAALTLGLEAIVSKVRSRRHLPAGQLTAGGDHADRCDNGHDANDGGDSPGHGDPARSGRQHDGQGPGSHHARAPTRHLPPDRDHSPPIDA